MSLFGSIVGTAIGGPWGGLAGTAVDAILGGDSGPSVNITGTPLANIFNGPWNAQTTGTYDDLPVYSPGDGAMDGSNQGGMIQTAGVIPPAMRAIGAMGRYITSARGIVSTFAGKIVGVMRGTKLFRVQAVADLAKRVGIDAAAAALGVTAVEVAQMIAAHLMQSAARRKRGRGISARDVRCTRRTIHKIRSIEHSLQGVCRPRTSRRKAAPAAFVRQG
jgi:hypothetical protein